MQKTAVSWVIYNETHSEFMLGLTLFASLFPSFLFSFLGGVVSDRYDRYKLLLLTQIASMAQAILMTLLVYFDPHAVWAIIGLSALLGLINAFDVPARQSLVYEMINDKSDLPNALALNSSMVNLSRLIGPGIAGIVLQQFGNDICFGLNAVSFIAVIGSLLMIKLPAYIKKPHIGNVIDDLKEGLLYIKKTPSIASLLLTLAVMSLLVLPFSTLIPVYAKDIFKGTAATFGVIDSMIGLGAFSGAIFLASLKPDKDLKKILALSTIVFGLGLIFFSHTTWYPLALVFAAVSGFGMMSQITISNTLIQTTVDPSMRGRVISFYAMAFFGMQPVGGLLIGILSQWIGTPDTVLAQGFVSLFIGIFLFYLLRTAARKKKNVEVVTDTSPIEESV